jgi:LPXTG-site transpeptidase (sortase) family protein
MSGSAESDLPPLAPFPRIWRIRRQPLQVLAAIASFGLILGSCGGDTAPPVSDTAADFRHDLKHGETFAAIELPQSEDAIPVHAGLDQKSVDRGGGFWYEHSMLPGEGGLVFVAGHRTTHGAPFRSLGSLRPGDEVLFRLPYAIAHYSVTGRRRVSEKAVRIAHSQVEAEQLRLLASTIPQGDRRLVVFADLDSIEPP